MKIALIQLPVNDPNNLYIEGNVFLAAGYLKASINSVNKKYDISIIPDNIAKFGSDFSVIKWILDNNFEVVGFTNYMWNIERHLFIVEKIKEVNKEIIVIFGGPEITSDFSNVNVDIIVVGEGEILFKKILNDIEAKNFQKIYINTCLNNLEEVSNPYINGILDIHDNVSVFLETMRGCPYKCKYCFYSKDFSKVRYFSLDIVGEVLRIANDKQAKEIYIMDPSFNVSKNFINKLKFIGKHNYNKIPLHTEMYLEAIDKEIADLMQLAGFQSIEAGLQSYNEKTLKAINRFFDEKKFLYGAKLLKERNIWPKLGVIIGLPFDTLDSFQRTLEFTIENDLYYYMEVYFLSILPGTKLKDEAELYRIEYMKKPPYYVLSSNGMSEYALFESISIYENYTDFQYYPDIIPHFGNFDSEIISFIDLTKQDVSLLDYLYDNQHKLSINLTILFKEKDIDSVVKFGNWLKRNDPNIMVKLVLDSNNKIDDNLFIRLSNAFFVSDHYLNRVYYFKQDNQNRFSTRVFHKTSNLEVISLYFSENRFADLVIDYKKGFYNQIKEYLPYYPIIYIDDKISVKEYENLINDYKESEEYIILSDSALKAFS